MVQLCRFGFDGPKVSRDRRQPFTTTIHGSDKHEALTNDNHPY